jgi:hypothetical protein
MRPNETMRLIFSAVIGVMLGYLFGISFPTVSITKVWRRFYIIFLSQTVVPVLTGAFHSFEWSLIQKFISKGSMNEK